MQNSTKTWQEEEQQFINQSANDINKELGKTWQEEFDDIFGENHHKICVGKNCECHKVVKQFISDLIAQTREETIREVLELVRDLDIFGYPAITKEEYKEMLNDILNKLKK